MRSFKQEYEAQFTADSSSFFLNEDIDNAIDPNLTEVYSSTERCYMGIDYGMTNCNTVITVVSEKNGKLNLLKQREFPLGFDDNQLMRAEVEDSIPNLIKRFNVTNIIGDDCPQGFRTNQEMKNMGLPIQLFSFRRDQADRNGGYVGFRSALHQGKVKFPRITELLRQMKGLEEVEGKVYTSIRKSAGGKDDRVDSLMMASIPFTTLGDTIFNSELVRPTKNNKGPLENSMHVEGLSGEELQEYLEESRKWGC